MKTAVLKEKGGLYLTDFPRPTPKADEVVIRVLVCGVCTSDMGAWQNGLGREIVLGHEVVGVIDELGSEVTGFQKGDRVTGSILSGYAEYTVAKAAGLLPVPGNLMDHEAIIEPGVCLMSGIERLGPSLGKSAAVIGSGYMGLCLIKLLVARGVTEITALDTRAEALANAAEMGATRCIRTPSEEAGGYPIVFETAGAAAALDLASDIAEQYGTVIIVGYHPYKQEIDLGLWASKAITIINSFEYRQREQLLYMRRLLTMASEHTLPTGRLMTHSFAFDQIEEAFSFHLKKETGYLKSYIRISDF